jgi:MFS family permease
VFLAIRHRLTTSAGRPITVVVVAWIFSAALGSAYIFYIFGPHFFDRYLHPVRVPLLLTIALLLDAVLPFFERAAIQAGVALVVVGLAVASQCSDPYFQALLFGKDTQNLGYRNLGLWARSTFPVGTVIGGSQTGAVGYFADNLKVVNLDGVVSKPCYESLVRHENLEYVRKEGVQYVFGWKVNFAFLVRMSKGLKPGDITDVKPILGFRSWNADWYVGKVRYPGEAPPPAQM